jgi:hypothetical protein
VLSSAHRKLLSDIKNVEVKNARNWDVKRMQFIFCLHYLVLRRVADGEMLT